MGYDRVVQILADNGADVTIKNTRGQTPLVQAASPPSTFETGAQAPHTSTIALLRKLGAKE